MLKITVLYGHPTDTAEFDRYYAETHAPLAQKMPGLRRYEWGRVLPGPDGSAPSKYYMADLWFDDSDALSAAMSSPEGEAAGADVANFASGGAEILVVELNSAS